MNAHTPIRAQRRTDRLSVEKAPPESLVIPPEDLALFSPTGIPYIGARQLRYLIQAEKERTLPKRASTRPASVRIATAADEPAIVELLRLDAAENADHIAPFSEKRALDHVQLGTRAKDRGTMGIVGVIDGPDRTPVAVCVLSAMQWWWSEQWYCCEIVNFVHPDHRRSHHIDDLLQFEEWTVDAWTRAFGYRVYLLYGVMGTKRRPAKVMLYWRRASEVGRAYIYPEPPPAPEPGKPT